MSLLQEEPLYLHGALNRSCMLYILELILLGTWITYLVTRSYIIAPLKDKLMTRSPILWYLLDCPVCFGTWVGGVLALVTSFGLKIPTLIFIIPAVSLTSYILVLFTDLLSEISKWLATVDHKHQETGK